MKKKTYELIIGVAGGLSAIAIAVVTYLKPQFATAINGSIEVGYVAICEICSKFIVADVEK